MKVQIYLKGIDELERQANKLIKEVNEGKQKILLDQAKLVRDRIREKAPRGPTGNLKGAAYASSIPASLTGPALAFAGIRPRKAPHAHLVEYGHAGPHPAPPHPFVRPAWDESRDEVERNIAAGLGKIVEGSV
jgi:HK97 gp10 family phage protein